MTPGLGNIQRRRTRARRARATLMRRTRCIVLLLTTFIVCVAGATEPADPFEPVVSRREAGVLQEAMYLSTNSLEAAIARLREADREDASAALDFTLGNLYVQTNRLEDAEAAYRAAIEKHPRFRAALNNLGRVLLMQDRPDAAAEMFAGLLRDGQADAESLLLLGHAYDLGGKSLSAEGAFRQALLLAPDSGDARRGLARALLAQGRLTECAALLGELVREQPGASELWNLLAGASVERGRNDDAIVALETARRLDAATPSMLATLGDLYINAGRPADAMIAYRAAFAAVDADAARRLRAVEALQALGEFDGARELLGDLRGEADSQVQALPAGQQHALRRLEAAQARLEGRIDDARRLTEAVLADNPLDGDALLMLGELYREAGSVEEAVMTFERAARLSGFEARGLVRQAQAEIERGRYAVAVELLERAQAFDPKPHVARYLEQVRRLVP
jgi:cytochrome c-type biogenesis protein CcmH/NrfG